MLRIHLQPFNGFPKTSSTPGASPKTDHSDVAQQSSHSIPLREARTTNLLKSEKLKVNSA